MSDDLGGSIEPIITIDRDRISKMLSLLSDGMEWQLESDEGQAVRGESAGFITDLAIAATAALWAHLAQDEFREIKAAEHRKLDAVMSLLSSDAIMEHFGMEGRRALDLVDDPDLMPEVKRQKKQGDRQRRKRREQAEAAIPGLYEHRTVRIAFTGGRVRASPVVGG
jgi:hypothetical protein